LCHRGGAAHFAENQNFHLKGAAVVGHLQPVTYMNLARSLGELPVRLDPAKFTGSRSQAARLEKSGSPQPFVDPNASHDLS
jgi:hypothetical protein